MGSILKWCHFCVESPRATIGRSQHPSFLLGGSLPGDLPVWLQVPHDGKSPGDLLHNIPKTWTSYVGGCWSICSWWSNSFFPSFLQELWLLPGPIGGCPSLRLSSPHMSVSSWQKTSHKCCDSWQQIPYRNQAKGHWLLTASILPLAVQMAT